MKGRRTGLWIGLAWTLAASEAAAAQPASIAARTVRATAPELLAIAELLLGRGDRRQAERLLVLLSRNPNAEIRNEARYRLALLLESSGRGKGAGVLLRRILDEKPRAANVRLKLAALLQRMGDEEAALRELRAVRSSDLPPTVARLIDRLSSTLQASKPLGFQIEVAIAPGSNVNRASSSETVGTIFGDFEIDEKAKYGVGASLRGLAHANIQMAGGVTLHARASGEASLYGDSRFNDISIGFSAGSAFRMGRTRLSAEAGVDQQWYAMKPYRRGLRLSGSIVQPVDAVSQVRLDTRLRWTNDKVNRLRDGAGISAQARFERALSPQLVAAASVTADRYRARDTAYSTRSLTAGVSVSREIDRVTIHAAAEVGRLKADERLAILPVARRDELTRLSVGAVFRNLTVSGFAPISRFVIERNRSTVEFYDYKQVRTEFGVSRAF